jgi:hypothetical protein
MSDPIPGNDSNAAYDVIPSQDWLHDWWTVTCNGIPKTIIVGRWCCRSAMGYAVLQEDRRCKTCRPI